MESQNPIPFAWIPLIALTAMNLLNFIDRFVVTALLPNIQRELQLNDSQGGMLGTVFMVALFLVSPLFGWVGDRDRRNTWLAVGVGLWSLATAAAGIAGQFTGLLLARAAVGVGEAAYGAISPSLLADYFRPSQRGRILSIFYTAVPVGAALGYLLGGVLGAQHGWRMAFYVVGLPGLLLAAWAFFLREPRRGQFDTLGMPEQSSIWAVYTALWHNRLYVCTVAGYTAYTFALGGMAFWMPSYMVRERQCELSQGMMLVGGITVVTGLVGTLFGGWLGDRLLERTNNGYMWVNVLSMVGATAGSALMLVVPSLAMSMICMAGAQVFAFLSVGPVNTIIVNSVSPQARATAVAVSVFFTHLLGDAISPTLIGTISDGSSLGHAMRVVTAVFLLAGAIWGLGLHPRVAAAPSPA